MKPKVKYPVVVVHGIGNRDGKSKAGFSKALYESVLEISSGGGFEGSWIEAAWEGVNDKFDEKMKSIVHDICKALEKERLEIVGAPERSKWQRIWAALACAALPVAAQGIPDALDLVFDLSLYMGEPRGGKIRQLVINQILEHQECVLVGHSLGSLICYDLLATSVSTSRCLPVRALVTFGSPLQWIEEIRKAEDPSRIPINLSIPWSNLFYDEDPICQCNPLDEAMFLGVTNIKIPRPDGFTDVKGPLKAHTAYWTDPTVAKTIRDFCCESTAP